MQDEPAMVIALTTVIVALLSSCGLALTDETKLAVGTLVAGFVLPLAQGLLTRLKVYSPLSAERLALTEPHALRRKRKEF